MKYLITIYAVFILLFDFYGESTQLWNIVYFAAQYVFAACVGLLLLFEGRRPRIIYLLSTAFFFVLAIFEVSMLRFYHSE